MNDVDTAAVVQICGPTPNTSTHHATKNSLPKPPADVIAGGGG